jgi:hypothetical protein
MRALASYLAGILTLIMLLAAGGAWSVAPEPRLVSVDIAETAGVASRFAPTVVAESPQVDPRPLPPGCRPPLRGATCSSVVAAGGLDVPVTYDDLVPDPITSLEDLRPLVSTFFQPRHVDLALRVIRCESRGNPTAKNPTSSASGLFQHLGSLWVGRAAKAGWEGADVFDPVANVAVAAWLVYEGGGWSHWYPSQACWG